jgi:hypothetical protein
MGGRTMSATLSTYRFAIPTTGKRVTLGTDRAGALAAVREQQITPLSRRAFVLSEQSLSA